MNCLARAPIALALLLPIALAACGGDAAKDRAPAPQAATPPATVQPATATQPSSELCRYGNRGKPVIIGHVGKDGVEYSGDVPTKELEQWPSRIASAVARPAKASFSQRMAKDCYNAQGRYWYACPQNVEVKLEDIRGIGRGHTYESAGRLALRICDQQVTERVLAAYGETLDAQGLRCEVIEREYCRIQPPAPKTPATKK
ncbi:MAG: hypothetical protein AB7G15_01970 [Alphaproteobacteria bacterium]